MVREFTCEGMVSYIAPVCESEPMSLCLQAIAFVP